MASGGRHPAWPGLGARHPENRSCNLLAQRAWRSVQWREAFCSLGPKGQPGCVTGRPWARCTANWKIPLPAKEWLPSHGHTRAESRAPSPPKGCFQKQLGCVHPWLSSGPCLRSRRGCPWWGMLGSREWGNPCPAPGHLTPPPPVPPLPHREPAPPARSALWGPGVRRGSFCRLTTGCGAS